MSCGYCLDVKDEWKKYIGTAVSLVLKIKWRICRDPSAKRRECLNLLWNNLCFASFRSRRAQGLREGLPGRNEMLYYVIKLTRFNSSTWNLFPTQTNSAIQLRKSIWRIYYFYCNCLQVINNYIFIIIHF